MWKLATTSFVSDIQQIFLKQTTCRKIILVQESKQRKKGRTTDIRSHQWMVPKCMVCTLFGLLLAEGGLKDEVTGSPTPEVEGMVVLIMHYCCCYCCYCTLFYCIFKIYSYIRLSSRVCTFVPSTCFSFWKKAFVKRSSLSINGIFGWGKIWRHLHITMLQFWAKFSNFLVRWSSLSGWFTSKIMKLRLDLLVMLRISFSGYCVDWFFHESNLSTDACQKLLTNLTHHNFDVSAVISLTKTDEEAAKEELD